MPEENSFVVFLDGARSSDVYIHLVLKEGTLNRVDNGMVGFVRNAWKDHLQKMGSATLKSPARLWKALHVPKPLHHGSSCFRNKDSLQTLTFPSFMDFFPVFCLFVPSDS